MNSTDKNNSIASLQNFQKNCPEKPHDQSGAIKKECKPGVDRGNPMPPPTDRKPGPALFLDGAAAQQSIRTSGAVVFGYLRSPFVEPDTQASTATFSSPTEVYLKIRRLLFVPEQVILLDRETRNVIVNWDLPKP